MRTQRAAPAINVTPLIDVLLVLLIIFMVISPLKAARFKALVPDEPAQSSRHIPADITTLVVSLDRQGGLRLNGGEPLGSASDTSRLALALTELFRQRSQARAFRGGVVDMAALPESERIEKTVFVKAPRSIAYGEVARVIDGIKGAGAQPIGLQIDELEP